MNWIKILNFIDRVFGYLRLLRVPLPELLQLPPFSPVLMQDLQKIFLNVPLVLSLLGLAYSGVPPQRLPGFSIQLPSQSHHDSLLLSHVAHHVVHHLHYDVPAFSIAAFAPSASAFSFYSFLFQALLVSEAPTLQQPAYLQPVASAHSFEK